MNSWYRLLMPVPAFAIIGVLLWLQRRQSKAKQKSGAEGLRQANEGPEDSAD